MDGDVRSPLRSPAWLILTLTLPLILLFLLWGKDLFIIYESCTKENLWAMGTFFSLLLCYGIGGSVTALVLRKKKSDFGAVPAIIFLAVDIIAMVLFAVTYSKMRPDVEEFILPLTRWIIYTFTFLMPSAVHSIMILADSFHGKKAVISSVTAVVGIPLTLFLGAHLLSTVSVNTRGAETLVLISFSSILVVFGVLFYLAVVKCLLVLIPMVMKWKYGRYLFPLIIGFVLPVAGLVLNIYIPFPCDLRSYWPFLFVIVNAVVLWLPVAGNRKIDYAAIYLKGLVYWFPLYFFLLFLPWLPLFVPAIIACGAGFLILTPTLLFLLQNYFYTTDYRKLTLPKKTVAAVFFAGILTVPALFFCKAYSDKQDLEEMVRIYYNLPYQMPLEEQKKILDIRELKQTVDRMVDARNGAEVPFVGEIYNAIVFNRLVVSDSQIFRMYSDLFENESRSGFQVFGVRDRYRPPALAGLQQRKTSNYVVKNSVQFTPSANGSEMELILRSTSSINSEYVGKMKLPEGVFISGLSLEINGKLERGAIAERKTALWIYEKITNARRDPALIYYTGTNELRFFIFPVEMKSPRRVVVDFLYPEGTSPEIELDGKKYKLPLRKGVPEVKLLSSADLSGKIVKRKPEIILMIDRSRWNSRNSMLEIRRYLNTLFPEAEQVRIVSGIVSADAMSPAYSMKELGKALTDFAEKYQPGTGGFVASNVIKGAILESRCLDKDHYPVFVLWSERPLYRGWDLHGFEEFAPEYPVLTSLSPYHQPKAYRFSDMQEVPAEGKAFPVARLDDGRVVRIDSGAVIGTGSGKYAAALNLRSDSLKLLRDPSLEKTLWVSLVKRSIEEEILIPQTSWIVLETEAQRKTLIEMQQKKLNSPSALDIENTDPTVIQTDSPEVALMILILVFLVCVGIFRNRPLLQRFFRKARNG